VRSELFDYDLPEARIAQTPIEPRDASRLLVVRAGGTREHRRFLELPELLEPGDLLVLNDTRVLPARLPGWKLDPNGAPGARIEALVHPGRRLDVGARLRFGDGELCGEVQSRSADGTRVIELHAGPAAGGADPDELLHRLGSAPLPPYIRAELADPERYQTVFARTEGSAAAPTAGLHFTAQVFDLLERRGVRLAWVTLHVGLATFRPIRAPEIEAHEMHAEWYSVPSETEDAIRACRGRVIAVGTTTVRTLESTRGLAGSGLTRLYITPGFRFSTVDALITNFHTPRSSLLVLVSAFAGHSAIRAAYDDALRSGSRFLSFGDAMFLERRAPNTTALGEEGSARNASVDSDASDREHSGESRVPQGPHGVVQGPGPSPGR
jgi:S-adenosylmethionine:tRNA ribosyltransferase-isomerase